MRVGWLMWILMPVASYSQASLDSAQLNVSLYSSIATDYQPFWFGANRKGIIAENRQNVAATASFELPGSLNKSWSYKVGAELVIRNSRANPYKNDQDFGLYPNQYFVNTKYRGLSLNFGASADTHSIIYDRLSSGDWGVSRNARPIPKVSLGFENYLDIPLTKGWVKIRWAFAQGWLEKDRFVQNPYLHEKYAYLKILDPWVINFELGLTHYALFGGKRDTIDTKVSAEDYWNIVRGREAEGIASGGYVPGSHLGTLDLAMNFSVGESSFKVFIQKPWEDAQQIGFQKFFKKYSNNADKLIGLHIKNPLNKGWLAHLVIEYMHSKLQTGPGMSDVPGGGAPSELDPDGTIFNQGYAYGQRENYYNNWFYGTGWTYYGRTIGTPLFLTSDRMRDIYNDVEFGLDYERTSVFNNRIEGIHFGASGEVSDKIGYELKFTYTRNFGNYYSQYGRYWERLGEEFFFEQGRTHYYLMTTLTHETDHRLVSQISVGYDFGEQKGSLGMLAKVSYRVIGR